jgi:DDE family transposase
MLFGDVFEKFEKESPVSVMTRALLENVLQPGPIDAMFERTAQEQYHNELLFSTVVEVMSLVSCGFYDSPHAVYTRRRQLFPVTLKSFYEKLQRIELPVMRQLVLDTATAMANIVTELGGTVPALLPGYQIKILDGNCLAATQHRLKELRELAAGPLPGKTLAVLDPQLGLIVDVFPCEDGHAQERSLLPAVLSTVQAGELWIEDRNFCTRDFLSGVARRQAFFLIREHQQLPWTEEEGSPLTFVGRVETGEVWEQVVTMAVANEEDQQVLGKVLRLRRLVIKLDKPTRDGDTELALLTNVWGVDALTFARLYLQRWQVEHAFQILTTELECEQSRLGYPKAALFAFCVAVLAYNILGVIKGALRVVHGNDQVEKEVSMHHLTEDVSKTYRGMMIAIPPTEWVIFRHLSAKDMAAGLIDLARLVNVATYKKAPTRAKKPKTTRKHDPEVPHVSTAQLLAKRRC